MKYTEAIETCLKEVDQDNLRLGDWQNTFAQVKDPRRKQGQRFTLTSMLLLALAAMLSNHVSELVIAQWGAAQSGVSPYHQTTTQVNIVHLESKPFQIQEEGHIPGWNAAASCSTRPR